MSETSRSTSISPLERTRVEQLASKFAEAWQSYRPGADDVYLSKFLPSPEDQLYVLMLHHLIPTDLAYRWRRGDKPLLEQYLESFPELGGASGLPVELIYDEYRIRTKYGHKPDLDSYQQRFPEQFVTFKTLLSQTINSSLAWSLPEELPIQAGATMTRTSSSEPIRSEGSRRIMPGGEGYELLECIGKGAFADVWRAFAPGGVEVAVKIIRWTASNKLSRVELRALELIKRLRHAFLLQVQAYWLSEGQLFIVMDLADRTLQQRKEECRKQGLPGIPVPELLGYLREVAEALDYLHANDVLHRDIKPANIMLASGHAKLADFGLARLVMEKGTDIHATTTGTPLYMSPEVWGNKVGPASDQYSLASTYVELRLGRPLFTAETYADVMLDHLHTRPDLAPLPEPEQKVLHKALAKENEQRYANCTEFVAALHAATIGDNRVAPQSLTRRAVLPLLAMLTTAIALGAVAWIWYPSHPLEISAPAALDVMAGKDTTFELHLMHAPANLKFEPAFRDVPTGLKFEPATSSGDADSDATIWRIRIASDLNLPEASYGRSYDVKTHVGTGEDAAEHVLRVTIQPPPMTVPPDCLPARHAVRVHVAADGKNYWNRIVRKLPGGVELASGKLCEFVLIPAGSGNAKVASFYMLENKVWNELFAAFDQQYPHDDQSDNELWPDAWRRLGAAKGADDLPADDHPLLPVMRANYRQANACALWLGGKLPTCEQWDTAAGRFLANPAPGPFQGVWDTAAALPQIAVNRVESGPIAVGTARDDISPFDIRDMAGNGSEWTRDASSGEFSTVVLRGRRYDKFEPLLFDHLREEGEQLDATKRNEVEREDPTATSPYIGFRVVIEP